MLIRNNYDQSLTNKTNEEKKYRMLKKEGDFKNKVNER